MSVTRSIVLNGSHGLAAVSLLGSKISPSAVRWPANPGPYQLDLAGEAALPAARLRRWRRAGRAREARAAGALGGELALDLRVDPGEHRPAGGDRRSRGRAAPIPGGELTATRPLWCRTRAAARPACPALPGSGGSCPPT